MKILLSKKKILVTGGAGFIGSNLCEALLEKDNQVICLDNFSTGKRRNIAPFLLDKNFTLIEGDIRSLNDCLRATKDADFVLHQAALGSVPRSIVDPITSNEVNVTGFLNMLMASRDNKVKRFVYAASSSTYGDSDELPKIEENIGAPLSPYAVTKYVNELYASVFSKTYDLETIGLRYFNVFGKRQDPDGAYAAVIPKFISSLINLESPTINGDGTNSRDFTFIDNIVQINLLSLVTDKSATNKVYNAAYGDRNTLNELMCILKEELGNYNSKIREVKVVHGANRLGDIPHSHANIHKAKTRLNYNPQFSLEQGLKASVKWYWENLKDE
ncbi:SDR family oxidoreductase [uncultured Polaribacter sp.]|uniref:SDR family oxidoreductase n=1 Tax=uncultured Polaribacter sp. TaxID=174711 RepID=UPI00260168DF|nr:SDR family oxidoreductase [uncultured Polaribacter sp.]